MCIGIEPLRLDTRLDEPAGRMARQGRKSLPVVDADDRVVGILTERDFLQRLEAKTFLDLLLRLAADQGVYTHRCHKTPVSAAMTAPAVTVTTDAGFREIVSAFRAHEGRSMTVIDARARLQGLLLRKDFLHAYHSEDLL